MCINKCNQDLDVFSVCQLLRQFEALLGNSLESSTTSRSDQPSNPTLTSPLVSAPPDASVKKPSSRSDSQAPSAGQEDQEEFCTDSVEESQQKEQSVLGNDNRTTDFYESSKPSVNHPRLSLFSGMELINRGKPVCLVEPVLVEPDTQTSAEAFNNIDMVVEKNSETTAEPSSSSSSEHTSAFSFLNL